MLPPFPVAPGHGSVSHLLHPHGLLAGLGLVFRPLSSARLGLSVLPVPSPEAASWPAPRPWSQRGVLV